MLTNTLTTMFAWSWILLQTGAVTPPTLYDRILNYCRKVPQERVFVHSDKPWYAPGDTVWFRAHVLDATTQIPMSLSQYVYVELVDLSADTLTLRTKVRCDSDGIFAGHLALPQSLHPGRYAIAAYTRWMCNFGAENFFYRQVTVAGRDGSEWAAAVPSPTAVSDSRDMMPLPPDRSDSLLSVGAHGGQLRIRSLAPDASCVVFGAGNLYVKEDMGGNVLRIDEHSLRGGHVVVALMDKKTQEVLARRHVFINGNGEAEVAITGQAPPGGRMPVTLSINITDQDGSPLNGTFSLSVADNGVVQPDTLQPGMGEYIDRKSEEDALRLPLADMAAGRLPTVRWGFETSQSISGEVRGTLRRKIKSPRLLLVNTLTGWRGDFALGDSSRFTVGGLDFPEGTTFTVEGVRHSGKNKFVEIKVDEEEYPQLQMPHFPTPPLPPTAFLDQEEKVLSFSFTDDGSVDLPEVVKTGKRHKVRYRNIMKVDPVRSMAKGDPRIERFPTIFHLLRFINAQWGNAKLYIDDFYCDQESMGNEEWLEGIMPDLVESVEYFTPHDPRTIVYGSDAVAGGLLLIYTKDPLVWAKNIDKTTLSTTMVKPQGYQLSKEFYSPQYTPGGDGGRLASDFRTTLYWSPKVRVENGRAEVTFFSSDVSRKYLITLYGVTDDGHVISKQTVIE